MIKFGLSTNLLQISRHLAVLVLCMLVIFSASAQALTNDDRRYLYTPFYDPDSGENSGSCTATLAGNNNIEKVWNFFTGKGYTPEQAAGILGNMQAESGVEPMRSQSKTAEEKISSAEVATGSWPGGPAWGIVQWDPPSKMINPSRDSGATFEQIDTVEHQVQFLWEQLEGEGVGASANEKAAGDHLKQQTTVDGAARSFMTKFERPRDQSEGKQQARAAIAENIFNSIGSGVPSSAGGVNSCSGDSGGGITGTCGPAPAPYTGSFGTGRPSGQLQHMLNELRDKCPQYADWVTADGGSCWRNQPGSGHYDGTACDISPFAKWGVAICPNGDTQACEAGYQVANWLLTYKEELGVYYVIWDGKGSADRLEELHDESDPGFKWYGNPRYCGVKPSSYEQVLSACGAVGGHFDHVHVSMKGGG